MAVLSPRAGRNQPAMRAQILGDQQNAFTVSFLRGLGEVEAAGNRVSLVDRRLCVTNGGPTSWLKQTEVSAKFGPAQTTSSARPRIKDFIAEVCV